MKYKYVVNKECRESCDGYYKLETEESSITYIKCYDSISDVLSINVEVYYNIKSKLCWKKYPSGYYILKQDASSTQKYEVVDECEHYYYSQSFAGSDPQIKYYCTKTCKPIATEGVTSLETTTATTQYFVKGKKNCETKCDLLNKYYYNPENNECLDTCKGLPGKEFAELDSLLSTASIKIYKCISSCTNYYDYDSNICLNNCGLGNNNYLYYANSGKICYPSCKDIPGGGYKYEVEDSNHAIECYKTQQASCNYFYLKQDGILKCLTHTDECENMKFKYILGKECTNDCGDYFTLEDEPFSGNPSTSSSYKYIKCYTKDDCLNSSPGGVGALYFNTKE